ncbi:MAG: ArnT family glycosyltransferase [Alphaproteobacteria bacterium]
MSKAGDQGGFAEPQPSSRISARHSVNRHAGGTHHGASLTASAVLFVLVLTAWRLAALSISDIDLFFDEAQYWYWAKNLDLGYFSKPPLLAWLIAGSTAILGDSEFGVRAFSAVCYAVTAIVSGKVALHLYNTRVAAWTTVMVALLPGVSVSATIASTDVPLLLCWAAALYCWVRYGRDGGAWWIGLGLALGAGMMAKYAMIYFLFGMVLTMLLVPSWRHLWRQGGLWGALVLAALVFAPNVWWNYANDFVSFGHTAENANWQGSNLKPHKLAEFAGAQFGVFGPILLLVFCWCLYRWRHLTQTERMLAAFAMPVLALMLFQSLVSRAHANWAAVAYISAAILVSGWLVRQAQERWLKLSFGLHLVVAGFVLHGAFLAPLVGVDPWHRQRGWTALAGDVRGLLDQHPGALLVTGNRKIAASMMYYVRPHPWDMVKWNPDGHIDDHYELTSSHAALKGRTSILLTRAEEPGDVAAAFAEVADLGTVSRHRLTRPPEVYHAFLLSGYRGE